MLSVACEAATGDERSSRTLAYQGAQRRDVAYKNSEVKLEVEMQYLEEEEVSRRIMPTRTLLPLSLLS